MAEELPPETDMIRFLRSGAGLAANPALSDAQRVMISEITSAPTGPLAAHLWLALIGAFLQPSLRPLGDGLDPQNVPYVGDLMTRAPRTARPDQTLSELVNQLFLAHSISFAPVVENNTLLGYVDIHMVQRIDRENWTNTTVDDVIESAGPDNTVSTALSADVLIARIAQTGRRKFLVATENELVGVVTLADLMACGVMRQLGHAPPSRR